MDQVKSLFEKRVKIKFFLVAGMSWTVCNLSNWMISYLRKDNLPKLFINDVDTLPGGSNSANQQSGFQLS